MPSEKSQGRWTPPYSAFRTLTNLIQRIEQEGAPPRIDSSYLTGSGGSRAQMLATLKALDLIGSKGDLKPALVELANRPEERPELIRVLLERHYPEPLRLGSINATQKQLEEAFDAYGISGDTKRKAIAFFLKGAAYSKVKLSPHWKTPASAPSEPRTRRTRRRTRKAAEPVMENGKPTGDDLERKYIEVLMDKVKEQDQMDDKILDRIESMLNRRKEGSGE